MRKNGASFGRTNSGSIGTRAVLVKREKELTAVSFNLCSVPDGSRSLKMFRIERGIQKERGRELRSLNLYPAAAGGTIGDSSTSMSQGLKSAEVD
ncbi:hypothetical protein Trydic_g14642 [Trypoxylus dichotomus]